MLEDENELALARRLVFEVGGRLAQARPTAKHMLDLSRSGDGWQVDVWRDGELEMRARGDLNAVGHRLAEWGGVI